MPTMRSSSRSSSCFLPLTTAMRMPSISRQALGPRLHRQAGHHRALQRAAAVASASTLKRPRTGGSLRLTGEGGHGGAQRQVELGADAGFVRGAAAAAGRTSGPAPPGPGSAARALGSSACSMPVVLLSPPAPGLSCVSAMTTGLLAVAASASAWLTASRAAQDLQLPLRRFGHRA
jgi:hypothetical protein